MSKDSKTGQRAGEVDGVKTQEVRIVYNFVGEL